MTTAPDEITIAPGDRTKRVVRTALSGGAILSIGAALVGPVQPAAAADFNVDSLADDGTGTTLREAIEQANAAAGPDVIRFTGAAATGAITLTGGEIPITDELTIVGPGASALTVSGNDASRIFYINSSASTVTISGLTLTEGSASGRGGAIYSEAALTLQDSVVSGSQADDDGGGVAVDGGASVTVSGSVFDDNRGYYGGGLQVADVDGPISITDTDFTGNHAQGDGGGLGVLYGSGPISITDTDFTGNYASSDGGGASFYGTAGDITITNAIVTNNDAPSDQAGGLVFNDLADGDVTIMGSTITGNEAATGGGIEFADSESSTLTITGSTISGNEARYAGGGLYADDSGDVTITGSTISGNNATYEGGGISLDNIGGTVTIERSTIADNEVTGAENSDGGGLSVQNADALIITSSTISGNSAGDSGGGIAIYDTESTVSHTTIADNHTDGDGGGVWLSSELASAATFDHVILADNTDGDGPNDIELGGGATATFTHSLLETANTAVDADAPGNLVGVDAGLAPLADNGGPTRTHALTATSPALNAGDAAFAPPPSTDQRGLPRVSDGRIDIGAFEAQAAAPEPEEPTGPDAPAPAPVPGGAAVPVTAQPRFTG